MDTEHESQRCQQFQTRRENRQQSSNQTFVSGFSCHQNKTGYLILLCLLFKSIQKTDKKGFSCQETFSDRFLECLKTYWSTARLYISELMQQWSEQNRFNADTFHLKALPLVRPVNAFFGLTTASGASSILICKNDSLFWSDGGLNRPKTTESKLGLFQKESP